MTGSGWDIYDTFDQFQFASQQLQGDMEVIARVDSLQGPDEWSKGGVMIRESMSSSARNVFVGATMANGWTFQRRLRPEWLHSAVGWAASARNGAGMGEARQTRGPVHRLLLPQRKHVDPHQQRYRADVLHGQCRPGGDSSQCRRTRFCSVLELCGSGSIVVRQRQPAAHGLDRQPAEQSRVTCPSPASMTINATASDSDGNVSRVDFYASGTLIGGDTSNPYSFNWTGVGSGTYSLTAVARDNAGGTTTSSAVNVIVSGSITNNTPTTLVFTPSADHNTLVTSVHGCALPQWRSGHGDAGGLEEPRQADTSQQRDFDVDLRHRESVTGRLVLRSGHGGWDGWIGSELAVVTIHEMS